MTERENQPMLLDVRRLSVVYTADKEVVHAVNDISLYLKKGEVLGLVGETGAGKTTVAKAIMSILPDPPAKITGGEIEFDGTNLLKLDEKQIRRIRGNKIAMIFQDPMTALNPMFTVGAQIAEAVAAHQKISKHEAKKRAAEMLEMVGIPGERYDEYPHQFSGGMKQRVVIAMALACSPKLLIADEPTTALDVTIQAQVLDMMTGLRERLGTSMILITHDLGIVAEMCDRVAIVYAGEIVETGTLEDIFDHPQHPYTRGLFQALPSLSMKNKRLRPIEGMIPDPTALPDGCKFHPRCPYSTQECRSCIPDLREITPGHFTRCVAARKEENKRGLHH